MREQYDDDINSFNYWPITLPPRPLAAMALALLDAGYPQSQVVSKTGLTTNRVLAIHRLPGKYDPVDDEVAIERAMNGDASVLPNLTFYERVTLRERLIDRYKVEPLDKSINNWNAELGEAYWVEQLAADWGVDYKRLLNRLQQAVHRRRKAAA